MKHQKIIITNAQNQQVEAQAPVIISASRATDIPAFYSNWFIRRLKKGYLQWQNPFNNKTSYVSFSQTRLIVFWSKNPAPMFQHLHWLNQHFPNYYFQFTLNDYNRSLEKYVPPLPQRIETFIKLSEKIGKERVIWRFDPLILTRDIDVETLLERIRNIGNQLHSHTQKLVISFADIQNYQKVQTNLQKASVAYREFSGDTMVQIAQGIQNLNKQWNLAIATCAEEIKLEQYGIIHNKCIDDQLIKKLFAHDTQLMHFIGYQPLPPDLFNPNYRLQKIKNLKLKDPGQRKFCGCILSKDIGQYNTCPHLCSYCYANTSAQAALQNYQRHKQNPSDEKII